MLNDGSGFKKVYLATGFTDLRRGIDGLARIIRLLMRVRTPERVKALPFLFIKRQSLYLIG